MVGSIKGLPIYRRQANIWSGVYNPPLAVKKKRCPLISCFDFDTFSLVQYQFNVGPEYYCTVIKN